jgi:hypothetical protein
VQVSALIMERTFYAVVTQFDCDEHFALNGEATMKREGPLLFECYLNDFARDQERVRRRAEGMARYGWARVAKVTVDIPDADASERAIECERFARVAESKGDTEAAIEARAAAWRAEQISKGA